MRRSRIGNGSVQHLASAHEGHPLGKQVCCWSLEDERVLGTVDGEKYTMLSGGVG